MSRAIAAALTACALWGLAFVAPALSGSQGFALTVVRYLVFGTSSVLMLCICRTNPFRVLDRRGWLRVLGLGLTGNTIYYALMSGGVLAAGPVPVTLVFGGLPVVMTIVGNLRRPAIPWRNLIAPVLLIVAGITITATGVVTRSTNDAIGNLPALGFLLAALSLLVWVVYGTWNAEYLSDHPGTDPITWASLTGLGTLITMPLLIIIDLVLTPQRQIDSFLEPTVLLWGAVLGIGASWIATWLWGRASIRLSAATLGMLIVTETLFAFVYACLIESRLPAPAEVIAYICAILGVLLGLRASRHGVRLAARTTELDRA